MPKPKITREQVEKILARKSVKDELLLVAFRGYADKKNKRGVFDDAMCLIGPHTFSTFNANTDPSSYRKGSGKGAKKGMASLNLGYYRAHGLGLHRGKYMALIQTMGRVTVTRDGDPPYQDGPGYFGINIHHGSPNNIGTSSLGCQTIRYDQWAAFISLVQNEMHALKFAVMPYLLVDVAELDA